MDINGAAGRVRLRANGSILIFDGFLKLYQEGRDDDQQDDENRRLPPIKERDAVKRNQVKPEQHFTEPPPRYSEASLVKRLEELGIGRPSTYASIIQVLIDRTYVKLDKKRFTPEDRGRLVTAFLHRFFERYVEYSFTADLEHLLDEISGGRANWKEVLRQFWDAFSLAIAGTKDLTITQVLDALDEALGPHFFPSDPTGKDPRACPACQQGRLSLKLGKFGAFIGCSAYPECRFTRPLAVEANGGGDAGETPIEAGPKLLGTDPQSGKPVTVRIGPYGPYVQLGEAEDGEKPKRVSLPRGMKAPGVSLDIALGLLSLPREIGTHPESGQMIQAGIGRFGPYLKLGSTYKSLAADDDVLTIGINRAVSLLAEAGKAARAASTPLRIVGPHPDDQADIGLFKGRYGPYVSHGGVNATIPRGTDPESLTLEAALALLAAQKAKAPTSKTGRKGATKGKTTPKKTAEKSTPRAKSKKAATEDAETAEPDQNAEPSVKRGKTGKAAETTAGKAKTTAPKKRAPKTTVPPPVEPPVNAEIPIKPKSSLRKASAPKPAPSSDRDLN